MWPFWIGTASIVVWSSRHLDGRGLAECAFPFVGTSTAPESVKSEHNRTYSSQPHPSSRVSRRK
jgi:hypothetical protein